MKPTLAIFSPSQKAYSETFIQAHKELNYKVKFYYGGYLPTSLENASPLVNFNFFEKIEFKVSLIRRHLITLYTTKDLMN
jgi:hypothetical protein